MNTLIFTRENKSIRSLTAVILGILISAPAFAGWTVDFSRREAQMPSLHADNSLDSAAGVQASAAPQESLIERVMDTTVPTQDIVILNTEQGFVPATVHVREGQQYRIVVVNVNEKARNVSFVMDAFSEHQATFYGKLNSFYISPKKDGVYSFESPETSAQGRLIVYPGESPSVPSVPAPAVPGQPSVDLSNRAPASE